MIGYLARNFCFLDDTVEQTDHMNGPSAFNAIFQPHEIFQNRNRFWSSGRLKQVVDVVPVNVSVVGELPNVIRIILSIPK